MSRPGNSIFEGRIISLAVEEHSLPDGRLAAFEIVRHPGGAAVLPVLADGRIVLVRQWRPAVAGTVLELPAGRLEVGEPPADCAWRELQEEVGYRPGRLEKLGEMLSSVGFCNERIHLYLASDLEAVPQALEQDEFLDILTISLDEALARLDRGEIPDGKTALALLLYARRRLAATPEVP
ncbi:MAG: NUDIX hydrolase [Trichloromonadaceae bacterium]